MFTLSAKGLYGLCALIDLAEHYEKGPKQIKDIADHHNIPQHYLEQILVSLKKGGVVESIRGAQGGYLLSRAPSKIQLMDALTILEGRLEVVPEAKRDNALAFFWSRLENHIASFLDGSLDRLLLEYQQNQNQLFYSI